MLKCNYLLTYQSVLVLANLLHDSEENNCTECLFIIAQQNVTETVKQGGISPDGWPPLSKQL